MANGWVKLHNKITSWGWYSDANVFRVFMHLLLTANYQEKEWMGHKIKPGQTVIGLVSLSETLEISIQSLRTAINKLKSTNEITVQSTNRFSIITVLKWEDYQSDTRKSTSKTTSQATNEQQTNNKPLTTPKEYKNIRSKDISSKQSLQDQKNPINILMGIFYEFNPTINFGNLTQRSAAEDLIKKFGLEKLTGMIEWYRTRMSDRFCPTATNPLAFKNKLGDIIAYADKLKEANKKREVIKI